MRDESKRILVPLCQKYFQLYVERVKHSQNRKHKVSCTIKKEQMNIEFKKMNTFEI